MRERKNRLFIILGGFFITNALLAEFIGVKIFSVESTLGIKPILVSVLGYTYSFNMSAGVLLWPVVFVMTDIINEYFGRRGVRLLSFMAAGLISYAFLMVFLAIRLSPADFWVSIRSGTGIHDMDLAFRSIFGQGLWIIVGSLTAFLIGQFADVFVFHKIRRITGDRMLWFRATGSTLVSQLVDTFVVLIIAFYIGQGWPLSQVIAVAAVNYIYKFLVAVVLTPTLYLVHAWIDRYLGKEVAEKMIAEAADESTG